MHNMVLNAIVNDKMIVYVIITSLGCSFNGIVTRGCVDVVFYVQLFIDDWL